MTAALALLPGASPAVAGCFTAGEPPRRAIYEDGSAMEYLGIEAGVLTYRHTGLTSRLWNGLLPLENKDDGFWIKYQWDGEAPTFDTVKANGGNQIFTGKRQRIGSPIEGVSAEITILGEEMIDWEDCRYNVVRFRKTIKVGGKKQSEGTLLMAPGPMISFESVSVEINSGQSYRFALKSLE